MSPLRCSDSPWNYWPFDKDPFHPRPSQTVATKCYPENPSPPATNQPTTARGRNRNASYIVRPTVQSAEETGDRFAVLQVEFDARIPFAMPLSHSRQSAMVQALGDEHPAVQLPERVWPGYINRPIFTSLSAYLEFSYCNHPHGKTRAFTNYYIYRDPILHH